MTIRPTPETIWKRPAYLPYVHSRLNEESITKAHNELGFELPEAYLEMLRIQNGGPIRFRIPDSVGERFAGFGLRFPCIPDNSFLDNQEYVDFPLRGLVPFDGDGYWYLCLDYRGGGREPTVAYVDVECNSEHQIAGSFSALLNKMELDLDGEHVMTNVDDVYDAREKLSESFGLRCNVKFNNIGVENSLFRSGDQVSEYFWISSNSVAAGYSGDTPKEFVFEGASLLFPELPAHAVIFNCANARVDEYQAKMAAVGLDIVGIEAAVNSQ